MPVAKRASNQGPAQQEANTKRTFLPAALACVLAIIAVAAVVLAVLGVTASSQATAGPDSREPVTITDVVRQGSVVETVDLEAELVPASAWSIASPVSDGTVTRGGLAAGSHADAGEVVAVVNERPVIVFTGDVPSYRALSEGSSGRDVAQLQSGLEALGYDIWDKEGFYGASTAGAVYYFYRDLDFPPVDAQGAPVTTLRAAGVPQGEIQYVPDLPRQATTSCGTPGDAAGTEICGLSSGDTKLIAKMTPAAQGHVDAGMEGTILLDGVDIAFTVGDAIDGDSLDESLTEEDEVQGDASEDSSENNDDQSTQPAEIALEVADSIELPQGELSGIAQIVIHASAEDALKAPGIAIRGDAESAWLETSGGDQLPVNIGVCADGFCEVSGNGVENGLEVTLSGAGIDEWAGPVP